MHETPADLARLQSLLDRSYEAAGAHLREVITPERRLDAVQLVERLEGMRLLVLATVTSDGRPVNGPVDGFFYRGDWYFGSSDTSLRFRHLRRITVRLIQLRQVPVNVGFQFLDAHGHEVRGNSAVSSTERGFVLWGSSDNTLSGNSAVNNGDRDEGWGVGFELGDGSSENLVTGNRARNNVDCDAGDAGTDNTWQDNDFKTWCTE